MKQGYITHSLPSTFCIMSDQVAKSDSLKGIDFWCDITLEEVWTMAKDFNKAMHDNNLNFTLGFLGESHRETGECKWREGEGINDHTNTSMSSLFVGAPASPWFQGTILHLLSLTPSSTTCLQ